MNTFIRLFRNFILLSIPLIVLCIFTYMDPMGYMSVEYPMWREEKDTVNNLFSEKEPSTVIIGDSRAKSGILPTIISEDGDIYNIAIGGATPVEMYYAVKNYINVHGAPENAVVIFAPFHFYEADNWDQTLYYNYLTLREIMEIEAEAIKCRDEKIIYNGWISDIISFKLRLPNKYLDQIYSARFVKNREENMKKYESVRKDMGFTSFGEEEYNGKLNYEAHQTRFNLSPMEDVYYRKLLDLLSSSGVNIIVEQGPINEASDASMHEEFMRGFEQYMEGIESNYPGVYVEKTIPVYDNSCFGDSNHLNRNGAERFTKEILKKHGSIF